MTRNRRLTVLLILEGQATALTQNSCARSNTDAVPTHRPLSFRSHSPMGTGERWAQPQFAHARAGVSARRPA